MPATTASRGESFGAVLRRAARRACTALQAAVGPSAAPNFTRIEAYANGERELELFVYTTDEQHWRRRLMQFEAALGQALSTVDPHAPIPSTLRKTSGYGRWMRFQRWRIPAPHGARVIVPLAEVLAVAHDLGIGDDTHVTSNSIRKDG
ncbi:hypothetical protein [Saccharopolyspora griseoalba]|uniref:Uncharacterized protein n=1 Tax=Saccharopolyspora griseoalba TaxID=1431848 RepID=A0ABW2LUH3_9PSEU